MIPNDNLKRAKTKPFHRKEKNCNVPFHGRIPLPLRTITKCFMHVFIKVVFQNMCVGVKINLERKRLSSSEVY